MSKEPEELKLEADQYLDNIKLYATHWGKALLIVGGTIFLTSKIVKVIAKKKKGDEVDKRINELQRKQYALATTKPTSRIFRMIKEQISLFLIAIAKQKVAEALNRRNIANGK